ncbi:MalY/PatB family protein [Anaerococcus sp. ENR1011]|uniref:cysteine-S-conjugate beta-lyase n=1 Tax=Anaerococcus groningensis TaxID=3115616 RepID=A0ABW9MZQ3_9FIRM
MTKYDFETISPRYGLGSGKWNEVESLYGRDNDIVPFSVADMEFELAPQIKDGICDFVQNTALGYSNPSPKFKEAVINWQKDVHNWEIEEEWILPSHGVVDAFFSAVNCYTQKGDGVILLTPVYYPMYEAIENNDRKIVGSRLKLNNNRYEIDFEDFENKCKDENNTMFILCSPHNPSGRIWSKEELKKLGDICNKYNVLVISDEIHNDLIMPGHTHVSYATIGKEYEDKSVILTSASKSFNIAGLQTSSVIIANKDLRDRFYGHIRTTTSNPKCNILGYKATEIAYNEGREWLDKCIEIIYKNYELIKDFMNENYPKIEVFDLESTYLMWMDFSKLGFTHKQLEQMNKKEAKIFLDEGYIFGEEGECFERWNLAAPTKVIEDALKRFKEVYDRHLEK